MKKPLFAFLCFISISLFSTVANCQSFTSNNPTTCNGNEGFITVGGLVAGTTYSVTYTDDGASIGPLLLTANGSGQVVISGLNAGLYSNFSLENGGNTTTLSIGIVLSNPIFIPIFASIPPICQGSTPPTLPGTSSNGITGTWSPATVNNNASGSYTFTPGGGQCGIPVTVTVTVTPKATPTFSFGTSLNICAGGSVPTLLNTSTNGITGAWSPATVDPNNSGTYTFTPDAGQCANSATFSVTVNPNITPTFAFGTSATICAGGSVPTLPATSGNGINGSWSPSTVDPNNSATYTFTPNAGQCATSATFTVTVNPILTPTFAFGTSMNICAGGAVPSLPTTSSNGITGSWNPATVNPTNSGTYTFTPTAGQCATTAAFSVTVNPNITPTFTFGTSSSICAGGSVPSLPSVSTNGINGVWSPSTVSNTNSGTYTFTPTAGQCATTATFSVTIKPIITPSFDINTYYICQGSTAPVLLTTSLEGITGTWSPATVSNTSDGVYTFNPTPGQCANTTTVEVYVMPNVSPTFNIGTSLTICSGATVPALPPTSNEGFTGVWSPAIVSSTSSGVYTFTPEAGQCAVPFTFTVTVNTTVTPSFAFGTSLTICSGGTVPSLPNTSSNSVNGSWAPSTVSNTNSGTYTFTPTGGQCAASVTFTVTVNPIITPTFAFGTSANICAGGSVPTLPGTSSNGIAGNWSPAVVDPNNSATYTFTPSAGQCAVSATFNVTVNPIITPAFSIGSSLTICSGGSVPVLPTVSNNGINGTWNPSIVSNTNSSTYTFTPTAGQGPCIQTVTYSVTVNPIITPVFSFANQSICIGATVPALVTTSTNGITGTWSPASIDNQNSGNYIFTPNAGQCANPITINVTVNSVPTVNVRSDTTINDMDLMPATFFTGSPSNAVYNWTNSNPAIGLTAAGTGSVPSFIAVNKGNNPITSIVTVTPMNGGCAGSSRSYKISVRPLNKDIFVPNVFSPNGDGKNDKLFAYGNYVDKIEMRIFNQWGQEVMFINNISQGWDGKHNGKPQPVGVYVYALKATMTDGRTIQLKGSITLLR